MDYWSKIHEQAGQYRHDARFFGQAHYIASARAARKQWWLAIPAAIVSAVVGTSIFATITLNPATGWKVVAGLVSLGAAVLGALQATFRFADVAETHRTAAASYGALRREFELFLLRLDLGDASHGFEQERAELLRLTGRFSELAADSPDIPEAAYRRAKAEVGDFRPTPTT